MPRRRAGVSYASGQSSTGRMFLDTRGQPTLGIALCSRCQIKRRLTDLVMDGNITGFMVCSPSLSPGCWDVYDPMRLPGPPPDRMQLPFVRPDNSLLPTPADDALLPLQPPS